MAAPLCLNPTQKKTLATELKVCATCKLNLETTKVYYARCMEDTTPSEAFWQTPEAIIIEILLGIGVGFAVSKAL